MRRDILRVAVAAVAVAVVAGAVSAFLASGSVPSPWVIEDLGRVAGEKGGARDINEQGQIVGWVDAGTRDDGADCLQAVLWENGKIRNVGQRDCSTGPLAFDLFLAINERGQIVGSSEAEDANDEPISHAFLWQNGKMNTLGTLGNDLRTLRGPSSTATAIIASLLQNGKMRDLATLRRHYPFGGEPVAGINERGEIAGSSRSTTGGIHAVLWRKGKLIDLGTLGGRDSFASAVNARSQVIGDSGTGTGSTGTGEGHAYIWENGKMTDLGTLGLGTNILGQVVGVSAYSQATRASAINEGGDVVGWSTTGTSQTHAFLWQNGRMIDLGTLKGDVESGAVALNDHGQIVGWSRAASGEPHPVLWSLRSG